LTIVFIEAVHGPGTCDFSTFTIGYCGEDREQPFAKAPWASRIGGKPFRGVNMGGLFVLEYAFFLKK